MYQYGVLATRFSFMISKLRNTSRTSHLVTFFDKSEKMSWLRNCSEIRPVWVLNLSDVTHRLEGEIRVMETEMSDDDDWVLIWSTRALRLLVCIINGFRGEVSRTSIRFDVDMLFRVRPDFERSIITGSPVWMTLHLSPFKFCSQGNK